MKRYKWLKRNLSEAQNGFFFFFNFIYLFHLRFMQASLLGASSWPAIKLLYTLQWCKALKLAYRASWGQGTPPWCKAVYLVLPILPQNNPWSIPCAPPCHEPWWQPSFSNTLQTSTTSAALQLLLHKGSPQPSGAQGLLCSEHRPCQPSTWGQRFQLRYRHEGSHILWSSKAKLISGFQGRSKAAGCFSTNEVIPLPF